MQTEDFDLARILCKHLRVDLGSYIFGPLFRLHNQGPYPRFLCLFRSWASLIRRGSVWIIEAEIGWLREHRDLAGIGVSEVRKFGGFHRERSVSGRYCTIGSDYDGEDDRSEPP
jgi:hypothetical protein